MAGTQGTPHRVVGSIVNGVIDSAKGLGTSVNSGVQSFGEGLQRGLDAPWKTFDGPEQPLRIADRVLDGGLRALDNAVNRGAFDTVEQAGEAIQSGFDHPVEQFGIPPALGSMGEMGRMGRMGAFRLPEFPQPFGR